MRDIFAIVGACISLEEMWFVNGGVERSLLRIEVDESTILFRRKHKYPMKVQLIIFIYDDINIRRNIIIL